MIIVFRGLQSPHTNLIFCLLAWLNPRINKYSKISQWKLEILKTFVQFDAELLPHLITCILRRENSNHDRLLSVVAALEVTTINQTLALNQALSTCYTKLCLRINQPLHCITFQTTSTCYFKA